LDGLNFSVFPDALSHQDNVYPREGEAFANNNPDNVRTIFSPLTHSDPPKVYLNLITLHSKTLKLRDAQLSDPWCRDIRNNIASHLKDYSILKNDLLLYKEKIVVPDNPSLKLSILKSRHDSPLAGHFRQEKTYSLISQDFSWPGMTRDVKDYVNSCYDCNCNKSSKHWKYGLLQPLPWHSLSIDFISQLPLLNGYDAILVV
ncbi:putative retrotransposon nucleocapsid protein, partial [Puccinia sorghi]